MARNRGGLNSLSLAYVRTAAEILDEMREHWPLTIRQLYYQLVAREIVPNRNSEYKKASRLLTKARLLGEIEWDAIEDRSRRHLPSGGWRGSETFVRDQLDGFLAGYRRDLLAGQPWALELWLEKDALSRFCHEVAVSYCVPVIVARGFSSVSMLDALRRRVQHALDMGKCGVRILYFGDLDPSGWFMLPSMLETLQVEMQLGRAVEGIRCALTPEQIEQYRLPHSVDAIKRGDTRRVQYQDWLRNHGHCDTLAVELDALPPAELQGLVREAIVGNIIVSRFETECEREREDRERLKSLRERAVSFVEGESW